MPFSKLFRSRWSALLWSAGILWTAVDIAGAPSPEPAGNAASAADLAAAANDQNMRLFVNMMDGR